MKEIESNKIIKINICLLLISFMLFLSTVIITNDSFKEILDLSKYLGMIKTIFIILIIISIITSTNVARRTTIKKESILLQKKSDNN